MDTERLKSLPNGVYRIHWKGGVGGVGVLGTLRNGERWWTSSDWTGSVADARNLVMFNFDHVESLTPIPLLGEATVEKKFFTFAAVFQMYGGDVDVAFGTVEANDLKDARKKAWEHIKKTLDKLGSSGALERYDFNIEDDSLDLRVVDPK